uniref:Uncharacterized protein n=1 Tax=Pygocentrus nattereri TaxID=42514 RepID=A0AAR2LP56_PYGNA
TWVRRHQVNTEPFSHHHPQQLSHEAWNAVFRLLSGAKLPEAVPDVLLRRQLWWTWNPLQLQVHPAWLRCHRNSTCAEDVGGVDADGAGAQLRLPALQLLQQRADLKEVGFAAQQGKLCEVPWQVQTVAAQEIEDVSEGFPIAVDEEVPIPVTEQRNLTGEHGTQHGVPATRERVQCGGVKLSTHVHTNGVTHSLTV